MLRLVAVFLGPLFLANAARDPSSPVKTLPGRRGACDDTAVLLQSQRHLTKQHVASERAELHSDVIQISAADFFAAPPEWRALELQQLYRATNATKATMFCVVLICLMLRLLADCMHSDLSSVFTEQSPRSKNKRQGSASNSGESAPRHVELRLTGMTCSACSSTIERCLRNHEGVRTASVNLIMERASIVYDGSKSSVAKLIEEVEDVGFEAVLISDSASEDDSSAGRAELHLQLNAASSAASADGLREREDLERAVGALNQALDGIEGVENWKALQGGVVRVAYRPSAVGARCLLNQVRDALPAWQVSCATPQEDDQIRDLQRQADKLWTNCKRSSVPAICVCLITLVLPACEVELGTISCIQFGDRQIHLHVATILVMALAAPVQFYYGADFHTQARKALQRGSPNMDVLVSLATNIAFGYASFAFIHRACSMMDSNGHAGHHHHQLGGANVLGLGCHSLHFFGMAPILMAVVLTGKFLEVQAKMQTMESLVRLMDWRSKTALLVTVDGKEECIPVELVQEGDTLRIKEGTGVPADGELTSDETVWVSEAVLTGESRPVEKSSGSVLMGGSTVVAGAGLLKATKVGSHTVLGEVRTLISNAQATKSRAQEVANIVARYFVSAVMVCSCVVFFTWLHLARSGRVTLPDDLSADRTTDQILFAAKFGMAVLMVACPCAMGLATPTAVMVATGVAARMGCLVKSAEALETGARVNTIVLDKTGTITTGQPVVQGVFFTPPEQLSPAMSLLNTAATAAAAATVKAPDASGTRCTLPTQSVGVAAASGDLGNDAGMLDTSSPTPPSRDWCPSAVVAHSMGDEEKAAYEQAFWHFVGMTEAASSHPLARCIVEAASSAVGCESFAPTTRFRTLVGKGVCANVDEAQQLEIRVGSLAFLEETCAEKGQPLNSSADVDGLRQWVEMMRISRHSAVVAHAVTKTGVCVLGALALRDKVRPNAAAVIRHLQHDLGMQVWMCTGDSITTSQAIAAEVGIPPDRVHAEALPARKAAKITAIRDAVGCFGGGARVCMVGDGINDGPALACADLGVAVGAGAKLAMDAADVIIVQSDLSSLVSYLQLCKETAATIRRNFAWAFVFNFCGLPVAAGVFYPTVVMPPLLAGVAMGLSSTLVVWSSLSLKSFQHRHLPL